MREWTKKEMSKKPAVEVPAGLVLGPDGSTCATASTREGGIKRGWGGDNTARRRRRKGYHIGSLGEGRVAFRRIVGAGGTVLAGEGAGADS